MSWWMWLTLAGVGGAVLGYFVGRLGSAGVKRSLQLDQDLRETRQELERYRTSVVEHFTTTAQLVNKLTDDYRAVYQHLARGAQDLTGGRTPQLEALTPKARQVEHMPSPPPLVDEFLEDAPDDGVAPIIRPEPELRPQRTRQEEVAATEGWYDDVAPGTEVPDYAREERKTGS
ncbi:MAG: YhcB family protein [Gammaproteobacteria bacterium]|jgi:uncharacterized membrane-anchored protein YhcB (DUF1043 family)|nr:YhcB family protein [Gammaproteobacteria bacterium]